MLSTEDKALLIGACVMGAVGGILAGAINETWVTVILFLVGILGIPVMYKAIHKWAKRRQAKDIQNARERYEAKVRDNA